MSRHWNPWHGCQKYSEGCLHCYVYRIDPKIDKKSNEITKNAEFDLPVRKKKDGSYQMGTGETVFTCLSSDFFLPQADVWRADAWKMIRARPDLHFMIITKRILRFYEELPSDWGEGYENVTILCTCENQKRADERLPFFLSLPIAHREIVCEPLLGEICLRPYLSDGKVERVTVGGESGDPNCVRPCDYNWVLSLRDDCIMSHVGFCFKQTGAAFVKDGKLYRIPRRLQQVQAKRAGIDLPIGGR